MNLKTLFASLLLLTFSARAAENIDVVKGASDSHLIPLAISGYSGEVDKVIRFDLSIMGFDLTSADKAQYILEGRNEGNVEGRLTDALSKASKLAKVYSGGSQRVQAHALADDVVQAVLGLPGIARTKIVFKRDMGKTAEIYVSDFDGFSPVQITSDNAIVSSPTWGTGRKTLYYTSYRATYPDIYSHDLATGERKVFARYPGSNLSPSVSRDGRHVAMILSKGGSPDVYIANADGSGLLQLTKTSDDESSPTFSPDGSKVCYAGREGRSLYIVPVTGGTPRRVATGGLPNPSEPDWSPDGKNIIFTSQAGMTFTLCVVPADGSSSPTPLVPGEHASWAPNSRTVVFVRRENNRRVLSLLDVPSKTVKSLPSNLGSCSQPCWSK